MNESGLTFEIAVQILQQHTNDPSSAKQAVSFLGEQSSTSPAIRERLAQRDILLSLLLLLDTSLTDLSAHALVAESILRCVGNAVSTSNEARETVCDHGFDWARTCLHADASRSVLKYRTLMTLYNLCFEHEVAQRRCYTERLHEDVLYYFGERYGGTDITWIDDASHLGDLLLPICDSRQKGDEFGDQGTRQRLLDFALTLRDNRCEVEDLAMAVELALGYLRDETEQARFIQDALIGKIWQILSLVEGRIAYETQTGAEENVKLLVPVSTSLTWILSDIAAHPAIQESYVSDKDFVHIETVRTIKASSSQGASQGAATNARLVSAACQILGNLLWATKSRDPSSYGIDVMEVDLHRGLMNSLAEFEETETLHSIAGLLIQMCRSSMSYKAKLAADDQLTPALEHLCQHRAKEVRQGALKLLQLLGKDDGVIRERYADLAKQVVQSLVSEQGQHQQGTDEQNGSVVELPD